LLSTRPEFGALTKELNLVGKQITMGKGITEALSEMVNRVKGKTFSKTMQLIISGIRSGGELAVLLDKTARDLIQKKLVTKKIKTNINLYVIFIFVAIGVGGPLLFGLSSYLIGILTEILNKVAIPKSPGVNLPFKISTVPTLDQAFVMQYSVAFLVTSVILGSLVLGLINKGKEKEGIKYILPLMAIALALFFIVRVVVKNLLGASLVIT
jgi:pilus assembly protein TadC